MLFFFFFHFFKEIKVKRFPFTVLLYFRQEDESAGEILEIRYKDRLLCLSA